jgi:hypothetical protein
MKRIHGLRWVAVLAYALSLSLGSTLFAQGLTTDAKPGDWEEINFEFDSAILSDGYPSLLRLAELLKQNPTYRLQLEGHTDSKGSVPYNERLGLQRANAVKDFLVKYGASASQISTSTQNKSSPKVSNTSDEGRFMNRRVVMTLRDGNGNIVAAGGVGDSISALQELIRKQEECCSEILKRLDKLDDILAALNGLKNENDKLRSELDQLKNNQDQLANRLAGRNDAPLAQDIAQATKALIDEDRSKDLYYGGHDSNKFTLLGLNFGPRTPDGNLTFNGRARYFNAFTKHLAVQSEGEYFYWKDRQEGQFDLGLVGRSGPAQLGLFSSFKHINFSDLGGGATLGQASGTFDLVFNRGRIGVFGTKAFLNDQLVASQFITNTRRLDTYAVAVDQFGFSGQVGLWSDAYLEGNIGALFRRYGDNKLGGMGRLVQPLNRRVALSVEGGVNETLVGPSNYGRLAVGVLFGSWLRPKDYATAEGPVPVDIPRVRYEVVTREVRTGNTPPVADAGGDRLGVSAGQFVLDGSASYDPDGDTLTYEWQQISGPTVALSGITTSRATFNAEENATYVFRLTVRDPEGASAVARATISTQRLGNGGNGGQNGALRISRFEASPMNVAPGESATLSWITEGAESVTITEVGDVEASGSRSVTPTQTTTYVLTATRGTSSVQSTVTVSISSAAAPRILRFAASNPQIAPGGQSTLMWEVENATEVSISNIGVVDRSGSSSVSPTETTTYTLTARNANGVTNANVVVSLAQLAKIIEFRATPTSVTQPNTPITLTWQTEGATEVIITGLGPVEPNGTREITPTAGVSYTLIAYGPVNNASAVVVVQVAGSGGGTGGPGGNRPPVANAGPDRTVNQVMFQLDGSASYDPDGDALQYSWRVLGNVAARVIDPESPTPTGFIYGGAEGEVVFELTVTDVHGAFTTDTVRIVITD